MIKVNHADQEMRNIIDFMKYAYKLLLITTKRKERQYKISR